MKEVMVMSLGGSLIVPQRPNPAWIDGFKKRIIRLSKKYNFVIVCGGGFIAREYITLLKAEHKSRKAQSMAGIAVTRMNARIMMQIVGEKANKDLPMKMEDIKKMLKSHSIVFCGALRYAPNQTSDSTAAKLASYLNARFINLTNVDGLYTDNPFKNKKAKFVPNISWSDFEKRAHIMKYKPGQHFVLDQKASTVIRKNKVTTYILGHNLRNLENLLNNKKFIGTTIQN